MKKTNAVGYVIAGVVVLLLAGFVYAWAVISAPMHAEFPKWTTGQLSLAFTLCMAFFCLGGLFNSRMMPKLGPRKTLKISAVLFIIGFVLTAFIPNIGVLYISYGVVAGLASGFSYNTIIATVTRWYPNKQATVSGILLMGFGFSSLIIGTVFSKMAAVTEADPIGNWRHTLLIMGIVMAIIIFALSFYIRGPKEGEVEEAAAATTDDSNVRSLNTKQMLGTGMFWIFFIWAILVSAAGLFVIQQAKGMIGVTAPSLSLGTVALLVGLLSVLNGCGRVLIGAIFDKAGRKVAMTLDSIIAVIAAALIFAGMGSGSFVVMIIGFLIMGVAYGGCPVMSAAFVKASFGPAFYAGNFGVITLSLLCASFVNQGITTVFSAVNGGDYVKTMPLIIVLMVIGIVLALILPKKLKEKN